MTTQDYFTRRILAAYAQVLASDPGKREIIHAKLREIIKSAPDRDYAARANQLIEESSKQTS